MSEDKPPIGIMPRELWLESIGGEVGRIRSELRMSDLEGAIKRYEDAGLEPSQEWIREWNLIKHELYGSK